MRDSRGIGSFAQTKLGFNILFRIPFDVILPLEMLLVDIAQIFLIILIINEVLLMLRNFIGSLDAIPHLVEMVLVDALLHLLVHLLLLLYFI